MKQLLTSEMKNRSTRVPTGITWPLLSANSALDIGRSADDYNRMRAMNSQVPNMNSFKGRMSSEDLATGILLRS